MTTPGPALPECDLGETRWRFAAAPLTLEAWSGLQAQLVGRLGQKPRPKTSLAMVWLATMLGVFLFFAAEQRLFGFEAVLTIYSLRHESLTAVLETGAVVAISFGLVLATAVALAVYGVRHRASFLRRYFDRLTGLRRPWELHVCERGLIQSSAGAVMSARWEQITGEAVAAGVWFVTTDLGAGFFIEEAALGDQREAVQAYVRERIGAAATATA